MANLKASSRPQGERNVRTYIAEGGGLARRLAVMQGTADGQAKAPTGAGVPCLGLVDEFAGAEAAGQPLAVVQFGETIGVAGEALGPNVPVATDGNGKLVSCAGTDANRIGYTRSTADADTDEVVVFVCPGHKRS